MCPTSISWIFFSVNYLSFWKCLLLLLLLVHYSSWIGTYFHSAVWTYYSMAYDIQYFSYIMDRVTFLIVFLPLLKVIGPNLWISWKYYPWLWSLVSHVTPVSWNRDFSSILHIPFAIIAYHVFPPLFLNYEFLQCFLIFFLSPLEL